MCVSASQIRDEKLRLQLMLGISTVLSRVYMPFCENKSHSSITESLGHLNIFIPMTCEASILKIVCSTTQPSADLPDPASPPNL